MMDYSTYEVVLLPTFVQVEQWRRRQAQVRSGGVFGQVATTFNAWIADLWELHGDGRALVDSVARSTLMRIAFELVASERTVTGDMDASDEFVGGAEFLAVTPGIAPLAARCEKEAAGLSEYDQAVSAAGEGRLLPGLTEREGAFLSGVARYRGLLAKVGLVEPGTACALLADQADEVFPRAMRVCLQDAAPLDWRMQRFFAACSQLELDVRPASGGQGVGRAPEGVVPRFAFPAGDYATPSLVMELADSLGEGETMVVTSADPLSLYKQLEPALARRGKVGAVQAPVRFGATDFGRAWLLLCRALHDDPWDAAALVDAASSPFSGVSPAQARDFDARIRRDRLSDRGTCLEELRQAHPGFELFERLVGDSLADGLLEHFEQMVREMPHRSPAWRAEQLAALAALHAVAGVAVAADGQVGADAKRMAPVLEQLAITVSYAGRVTGREVQPQVLVTTQGAASRLGKGSCAMLVACDLTSEKYPVAERDDAAATLFARLGLDPADTALSRAQRTFHALMQVPVRAFVCLRPLNDADGNPAYPCAVFEEFVDSYRADPTSDADLDDTCGIPLPFARESLQRGEELLYANARAELNATQRISARVGMPDTGTVSPVAAANMMLPRRAWAEGERATLQRSPSPSQIELYLECPYQWFVSRRLEIERLEEGFGALEKGNFAHAVLERFYREFMQAGHAKVNSGNISQARMLLQQVSDAVEAEMRMDKPGGGRLVAANSLDTREIAHLKTQLVTYLDFERQLLPGFHPAYLEYAFDAAHPASYAGCQLVGKIDRIDVDDAGNAVVIDYKGSVNSEHEILGKDALHPGKVQTRIYAQLVRRELGLNVVGALYVSYGGHHAVAGAVDARAIEQAHVPGSKPEAVRCAAVDPDAPSEAPYADLTFATMLDETEKRVAEAVDAMECGRVMPRPSAPNACVYCPVASCPKRGE